MDARKHFSMDRFIDEYIDHVHKPESGKNIVFSLLNTALLNAVTLPFGRSTISIQRSIPKSDIKKMINAKLYWQFNVGFFSKYTNEADSKRKKKEILENFFDRLDYDGKVKVLNLSFDKPEVYLILADKIIAESSHNSKSA